MSTTLYTILAWYSFEYFIVASKIISLYDEIVTGTVLQNNPFF